MSRDLYSEIRTGDARNVASLSEVSRTDRRCLDILGSLDGGFESGDRLGDRSFLMVSEICFISPPLFVCRCDHRKYRIYVSHEMAGSGFHYSDSRFSPLDRWYGLSLRVCSESRDLVDSSRSRWTARILFLIRSESHRGILFCSPRSRS